MRKNGANLSICSWIKYIDAIKCQRKLINFCLFDFTDGTVVDLYIWPGPKTLSFHKLGRFALFLWEEGPTIMFADSEQKKTKHNKKPGGEQTKTLEGTESENRLKPRYGRNNAHLNVWIIRLPSIYQVVLTQMAQIFHNLVHNLGVMLLRSIKNQFQTI